MWSVSCGQLPGKGEDLLPLPSSLLRCLVRGSIYTDRRWWDNGEKGLEKEIGTFGVEVHRQRSVELCSRDAEGYDGDCDGRPGDLGSWVGDGTEGWKVGTVGGKDDVVGGVEGDLVATVGGSVVGLRGIDGEHVGRHLGREIVYHDGELLRESRR